MRDDQEEKNMEKNNTTELVFILDRSGSMSGLEGDTIGGFNSMIEEQKEKDGACYVTTILFNDRSLTIHDRIPLTEVPKMTRDDYRVCGCTALIDAIGAAIEHTEMIHKYVRKEDVPAHTLFMITTDGLENASTKYSSKEVKRMIEQKKEKEGWEFVFIGANIDAVETARHFGIQEDRVANYHADKVGTGVVYRAMSAVVGNMRNGCDYCSEDLEEVRKDYKSRRK